jgi:hypothetical protein
MKCISESFKVSSSDNSPTCPRTRQVTYITSIIEYNNQVRYYAIFFKTANSGKGGCAFLESGWSVKDLGMARFIFASSPPPGGQRRPVTSPEFDRIWRHAPEQTSRNQLNRGLVSPASAAAARCSTTSPERDRPPSRSESDF